MAIITDSLVFALPVLIVLGLVAAANRAMTLFVVTIRDHKVITARGRIPPTLLRDFLDVSPHGHDARVVIRCRIVQGRAELNLKGTLSEATHQKFRNLLGLWPVARLKSAPRHR